MNRRLALALLLLAPWTVAAGQAESGPPHIDIAVITGNSPPLGAAIRSQRILSDAHMRDLLTSGFPAALSYRLELWRVGGLFDDLESSVAWQVLVRYEPYTQKYQVVRREPPRASEVSDTISSLSAVEQLIGAPYRVDLRPGRGGAQYYYNVVLDVETLSVSDLDEVQRWVRGDLQPAVRGKRDPFTALRRGIGTLLSRVLGGEKRHYEARSGKFTS